MVQPEDKRAASAYRLSYSLLAVLLLLTVGASFSFYKTAFERDAVRFNATAKRLQTGIVNKVDLYVTLLTGVRGFVMASPGVSRDSFGRYVESLRRESQYPAPKYIGFVKTVSQSDLPKYLNEMSAIGYPNLKVQKPLDRTNLQLLTLAAPEREMSRAAIGIDFSIDPIRQAAMMRAADTGSAAMTSPVDPIFSDDSANREISIFLPVYAESDGFFKETATGKAPLGYVYASFSPGDFVKEIEKSEGEKDVAIQLFDTEALPGNLIAETGQSEKRTFAPSGDVQTLSSDISLPGRTWAVRFATLPAFIKSSAVGWVPAVFAAGVCFSLLVFGFTYRDATRRHDLQKLTGDLLTAQKANESLLALEQSARREAEEANRAKDEFLAIVSHELKTPLNTIAGWTTILRGDQVPAATRETALRKIDKNLRLEAGMVEQLLNFSQIMADSVPLSYSAVPARAIFDRAVASVERTAAEKTIVLNAVDELDGELIYADADKLKLALVNVLANAIKFTERGGTIEARAEAADGSVAFVIKDNGSGIDQGFLPHVFEPYRQGVRPAIRSYGGLGLGLAITKHIIEMHGGSVEPASAGLGRGATFTLRLPVKSGESGVSE